VHKLDSTSIESPAIFNLIAERGQVPREEMFRTFNMGIGYVLAVAPHHCDEALKCLHSKEEKPIVIGRVSRDLKGVVIK